MRYYVYAQLHDKAVFKPLGNSVHLGEEQKKLKLIGRSFGMDGL